MKFELPGWMTHNLYPWQLDVRAFPEKVVLDALLQPAPAGGVALLLQR